MPNIPEVLIEFLEGLSAEDTEKVWIFLDQEEFAVDMMMDAIAISHIGMHIF